MEELLESLHEPAALRNEGVLILLSIFPYCRTVLHN